MAERDITYCVVELQHAFYFAKEKFEKEHPEKPQPFLTCTFRSNIEQDELYAQGRTKPGKIVTYLQIKKGN